MYKILRFFLFLMDAEEAHYATLKSLKIIVKIPLLGWLIKQYFTIKNKKLEKQFFGLNFKNPVGLAAGLDKNAAYIEALSCLGFGFIEVGTVTPLPQDGNPKPRLFRIKQDKAIINRMGFNNAGMEVVRNNILNYRNKHPKSNLIIGVNIGKNKETPNETAKEDYIKCFNHLYDMADYFVVNVSSPNTPDLRALQEKEPLQDIIFSLQNQNKYKDKLKPILLKIAPDLSKEQLNDILEIVDNTNLSGIIATNTTIGRDGITLYENELNEIGSGGLSGEPLTDSSTFVIEHLRNKNHDIPIIGVGGIMSAKNAKEKMQFGADLVQVYTGLIYEGPSLVKQINRQLKK